MSNFYYNEKGERVYGYSNKPANLYLQPPKNTDKKVAGSTKNTAVKTTATDYYAAAIARQTDLLRAQYERQERQRRQNMQATIRQNNARADEDLKQAYILNMMQQKNLGQKLKSQGLSGGASETVMADMSNTYMNNRNEIKKHLAMANAQAKADYSDGASNAYQKYLSYQSQLLKSAFLNGNKSQQQALYNYLLTQKL